LTSFTVAAGTTQTGAAPDGLVLPLLLPITGLPARPVLGFTHLAGMRLIGAVGAPGAWPAPPPQRPGRCFWPT
jgi:hypothetical protein